MPAEIEVPLEKIQQDLEHAAAHGDGGGHGHEPSKGIGWITWSALLSAILAVLAAVAALQAGHHVNEAMMEQIKASNQWSYYQAKSIKSSILDSRVEILQGLGKTVPPEGADKKAAYEREKDEITKQAKEHEAASGAHFHKHEIFATAVTFYQIAIAVTAIAVLAKRRQFLLVAGAFGVVGLFYIGQGFLGASGH